MYVFVSRSYAYNPTHSLNKSFWSKRILFDRHKKSINMCPGTSIEATILQTFTTSRTMYSFKYILLAISSLAVCCTTTNTITTYSRDIEQRSEDTTIRQQIVWPNDPKDNITNSKTERLLEDLTQQKHVFAERDSSQILVYWLVNVTNAQVDTIKKTEGL